MPGPALPIDAVLPAIVDAVRRTGRVILRAEPAAGKTTRVPGTLLDAGLAADRTVLVLEPRRVAARAAAAFVARERGGAVGGEVGYRIRFEQRGGPATRLWFVTEGVFGRMLADDSFLESVGVLVLDEFHERHLHGDLALAVARELQEAVRPDLRLVVMSATLDTDALARHLPGATVLTATGRTFPVAITHAAMPPHEPLPVGVARAVGRVLDTPGDVLVFLPGAAEIRRTAEALAPLAATRALDVVPLHGDLPLEAQLRALRAGPRRRVVLATNVAESALTVEGVTTVVDSGLARVARFDPRHGINVLRRAPVSCASADQRAGRAGRVGPGRCVRLWSTVEHAARRPHETPEVRRVELSRTVLELRAWGLRDAAGLPWLDPPAPAALAAADRLLHLLGAIDAEGSITAVGRRLLALPLSPRLARIVVEAERLRCAASGALLAALAAERDVLRDVRAFGAPATARWPTGSSDLLLRADLVRDAAARGAGSEACRAAGLEPGAVRAVLRARRHILRIARAPEQDAVEPDEATLLRCVLAGFADRVARRRAPVSPQAVMVGGTGLALAPARVVRDAELFVAVDLDAGDRRSRADALVRVASAIDVRWLADVATTQRLLFDPARQRVVARREVRYQDLVLAEHVDLDVDPAAAGTVLAAHVRAAPRDALVVDRDADALLARVRFLAAAMPALGLPDDPEALLADVAAALCAGRTRLADLRGVHVAAALATRLTAAQRAALDREAPAHHRLPSGRTAPIRYAPGRPPIVAARIQECFGLAATPRLAGGRIALVIELLGPNARPVQTTADLASFWATTYPDVRRELRGRYPKHHWPEDPTTGVPTRRPARTPR